MVAIIKTSSNLGNVLHYNENKLKQKVAELIHSMNFGKDTERLGFTDKIRTLQKLTALNERTKLNAVHISLNFDPNEKLAREKLQKITDAYMQRIGFGLQPYLVYKHTDAGHPHVHVVTTNIQHDGSGIKMKDIGRNQSEKARKEIEKEFKLVQAQQQQIKQVYALQPVNVQKVQYGHNETKRAITNVLDAIIPNYKYASLPELNAVLKQYNIVADRGSENSRTFSNNGLVYRVLDEKGQKVGSPIKSSAIYNKPGLKYLSEKFIQNAPLKQPHKLRVKNAVDLSITKHAGQTIFKLVDALEKEKIQVVLRQNDKGIIYGITYIDHQSKCVFNGSDLGKQYSANQMQERCGQVPGQIPEMAQKLQHNISEEHAIKVPLELQNDKVIVTHNSLLNDALKVMTKSENEETIPYELRQEQIRRRKKKRLHQ
jgi:hypothetical protein